MVPVVCRTIEDSVEAQKRQVGELESLLATLPATEQPEVIARLRVANETLAQTRAELGACIQDNLPGAPLPEVTLAKADIDREVYLAIAANSAPETDVLAGIFRHLISLRPDLSADELKQSAETLAAAITQHQPDPSRDLSPNDAFRMSRILAAVVPTFTDPLLQEAARNYTRAFLRSFRRGATQRRQVQPLELQFDQVAGVQRLRREVWRELHAAAVAEEAVATAIDTGPLGAALQVATTDAAATAVAKVQLPALQSLVDEHIQADGSLVMPSGQVQARLAQLGTTIAGLRESYAVNLIEINIAIGKAEEKKDEDLSGLAAAIKKAETEQKRLDELLKGIAGGAESGLGVLAAIADRRDPELGGDIREFAAISVGMLNAIRSVSSASIQVGKVLNGIASASASKLLLGGGVGFAFVMVALMIQVSGLFGKSRSKPINQVILEEVGKLSQLVTDLRDEMRARFDRLDQRLDRMYSGILTRLAEIDFNLGQVEGNVGELQASLYQLHTELTRLTADLQAQLDAAHRRDLVEAINGFLNFQQRTGQPIDAQSFFEAENLFYSWGNDHAKDALQAGPEQRDFTDDDLLRELISLGAAANVNYLRLLPAERFGLAPLAENRLANPIDWIIAAEAYAQLNEEAPALAGQIADSRVQDLIAVGETLAESLSRIADPQLFTALANHYRARFDEALTAIGSFEQEFRIAPRNQLHGIDLWGGPEQMPSRHFFTSDAWVELGPCEGGRFDASSSRLPTSVLTDLDQAALAPYLIADNLSRSQLPGVASGLSQLGACISASWRTISVEELGIGALVRITSELTITVNIRYGTEIVYRYTADTPERFAATVRNTEVGNFDPNKEPGGRNPLPPLVGDKNLWLKMASFRRRQSIVNPTLKAATATAVAAKLRLAQRAFYNEVAERLAQAGDPIGVRGQRLTGSKVLWQNLIMFGLPISIQANELLRSLLFGGNALLAGGDNDSEDTLLDDLRDLYAFFGGRAEEPPPANIVGEIRTLALDRLRQLTSLLDGILESGDPPEPPQVFAPTLLRLGLLEP